MHINRMKTLAVATTALASLALAGGVQAESAKKGGTLTVALETDVRGFDSVEGGVLGISGGFVSNAIHEPLINYLPNGKHWSRLATEWSVSDDQKVWTLKLQKGIKFHNGEELTASDVAAHYNRILDPKNKSRSRSFISAIKNVTAVDSHTAQFELAHPWAAFLPFMGTRTMSGLIPSAKNVEAGKQNREPVGTGPFVFKNWAGGDRIVVERNPNYWNADRVHLDKIVFRILPDTQARYAALKAGEVDMIWTDRGNTIVRAKADSDLVTHSVDGRGALITFFNASQPPLDDKRVRQALSHAWNQDVILKVTWKDTVPFATHPLGAGNACGEAGYLKYDPEKAKALLADYGKPVKLSMIHTTTPRGKELGEVMQQLYKKVGVDLELQPVDQNTLVKRVFTNKYQISGWRIADGADVGPQLFALHYSKSPYNLAHVKSPDLDKLVLGMRTAADPAKRDALQCEISKFMNDSAHIQYRGGRRYHVFTRNYVKNVPTPWTGVTELTSVWLDK